MDEQMQSDFIQRARKQAASLEQTYLWFSDQSACKSTQWIHYVFNSTVKAV